MDVFSKRGYEEDFKSIILDVANLAKLDKQKGNKIIDASIGTFYNDSCELGSISLVKEALKNHITCDLGYGSIIGSNKYKELMLRWFLKDDYEYISKNYRIPFAATLGGTGAVSASMHLFLDEGETILLPDIMWTNYKLVADKANLNYLCYSLFNEKGMFNITDLIYKVKELKKTQKKIAIIINDPCHNPTGYCMTEEEYTNLYSFLDEEAKDCDITLLLDIAYIDYDECKNKKHLIFDVALRKDYNFNILFMASCSKTFGIYGLRIGALFTFTKNEEYERIFINSYKSFARGIYSMPNTSSISAICSILKDDKMTLVQEEVKKNSEVLIKRGKEMERLLNLYNIKHYPYKNGFFVTLVTDGKANLIFEELRLKHMYVVPMDENNIRLSVSNLKINEIKPLVDSIKEVYIKYSI